MSENPTANAINHVFVTSDGDGFMITSPNTINVKLADAITFAVKWYVHTHSNIDELNVLLSPIVNGSIDIGHDLTLGTYYYDANQFTGASQELIDALNIAFKIICIYPSDFAHYITGCNFNDQSSWGASLYTHDHRQSGIIGRYISNQSRITLTDPNGNEILLIPKALNSSINEVIPELSTVDFSTMKHTINAISATLRGQVKSLRANVKTEAENAYKRGYDAGISVLSSMPEGWTVGNIPGVLNKCFIWNGDFHPHYIDVGGGVVYKIPDEIVPLLRISSLAVKLDDKIRAVYGRGNYPHIEGIENIEGDDVRYHVVCIGSMIGAAFNRINELLPMFDTINANSMHGGAASKIVRYLVGNERYTVDDANGVFDMGGGRVSISNNQWVPVFKHAGRLSGNTEHDASDTIWRI